MYRLIVLRKFILYGLLLPIMPKAEVNKIFGIGSSRPSPDIADQNSPTCSIVNLPQLSPIDAVIRTEVEGAIDLGQVLGIGDWNL